MTPQTHLTRRDALRSVAIGALALPFLKTSLLAAESPAATQSVPATAASNSLGREHGLRLGVASYSTRTMTLDETLSVLSLLRVKNTGLFKAHCDWENATVEQCRAVGAKLREAGVNLTGSGVINLPNDEAKLRKAFENVRAAEMATMVCKPQLAALPAVEKLVKEFDQKIAIHNHGPEDSLFPTPQSAFDVIKTLDSRIGLCVDVGHAARAGVDPAASIRQYAARVYDIHMKDSVAIVGATKDIPMEVGAGRLDIRSILAALKEIKYSGVVAFEYEKPVANPVTGLAESIGYVRGMLAAMS